MPARSDPTTTPAAAGFRLVRFLPLVVIAVISVTVITMGWHKQLSFVALVDRRDAIDAFVAEHRIAALASFAGTYALAVAFSLPGAAFLTICCGFVFGTLVGGMVAIVGATVGATVIFLIARSALGGWLVRRAGPRTESLAAGFCADAFNYLLFLRLVPVFPFWLVNLVAGAVGLRLWVYLLGTFVGIIPGPSHSRSSVPGLTARSRFRRQPITPAFRPKARIAASISTPAQPRHLR